MKTTSYLWTLLVNFADKLISASYVRQKFYICTLPCVVYALLVTERVLFAFSDNAVGSILIFNLPVFGN